MCPKCPSVVNINFCSLKLDRRKVILLGLCCNVAGESASRYPQTGRCCKDDRSQGIRNFQGIFVTMQQECCVINIRGFDFCAVTLKNQL